MSLDGRHPRFRAGGLAVPGAHPGWRLTRLHPPFGKEERERTEIARFYESFAGGGTKGAVDAYRPLFAEWKRQVTEAVGSHGVWEWATAGRLAFGQGDELVTEIGLRLHHTWGMPVVSGAALKGVSVDCARERFGLDASDLTSLFGSTAEAGRIRFLDAVWVPVTGAPSLTAGPLALDTITVHHPDWYQGDTPPTDWDSPTPLVHLTATGSFLFAVDAEAPTPEGRRTLQAFARRVLSVALAERGVGSRTRKGYGRFSTGHQPEPPAGSAPGVGGGAPGRVAAPVMTSGGTSRATVTWNPGRGQFELSFREGQPAKKLLLPPQPEPFGGPEAVEAFKKQARAKGSIEATVEWTMDGMSPRVTRVSKA